MIKLTYTEEMRKNDEIWKVEKEDVELMKRLYEEIYQEALSKGFNQLIFIYDYNNEALVEVYLDEEDKELCELGVNEPESFGFCKSFIRYIEDVLNY